jgi:hypothetical protein
VLLAINDRRDAEMSDLLPHEQALLAVVENKIQLLLLTLDEQLGIALGKRICGVEVDTRNFANMKTEIHIIKKAVLE